MIFESHCKIDLTRENKSYTAYLVLGLDTGTNSAAMKYVLSSNEQIELESQKYQKRRIEYKLGRYIAKKSVSHFYKDTKLNQISIERGIFNQPVLYCPNNVKNIQVSISHTNNIAVSIAFPEEHPLGVDIEKVSDTTVEALKAKMLYKEMDLLQSVQMDKNPGLTMLWTVKESLSKVMKTGLTVPLSIYAVKKMNRVENGYICEFDHFIQYKTFSWIIDHYICTICLPKNTSFSLDIERINALLQ